MLAKEFIALLNRYTNDENSIALWREVKNQHTKTNRFYHNLSHLEHLYHQLLPVQEKINDWDMALFALFYHDFIYNALKKDNEERSAKKAVKILNSIHLATSRINHCSSIILATKGHQKSDNTDINYFTDADLSILGSEWNRYQNYYTQVRKEYKYFPDFVYNKGRIKALQHFLNLPHIFKTEYFYNIFEEQAKKNIEQEIVLLS